MCAFPNEHVCQSTGDTVVPFIGARSASTKFQTYKLRN